MIFHYLAVAAVLCVPSSVAFGVRSPCATSSALRAATPINEALVTREANVKPTLRTRPTLDPFNPEFSRIEGVPYNDAFPNSTREHTIVTHETTGHVLTVPFRRVHLEDPDMPYLDLYDTAGPRDVDPREGLPKIRQEWVMGREGKFERYTQMHFARKGMITEEMLYVAEREGAKPEFVRDEIAKGELFLVTRASGRSRRIQFIKLSSFCHLTQPRDLYAANSCYSHHTHL